jgi:RNase P/RNase MRP subunit POP5
MVRFKTRWILVKIETRQDVLIHGDTEATLQGNLASRISRTNQGDDTTSSICLSKKEFIGRLRKTISWCYGLSGEPIVAHTLVRWYDPTTRLLLIRCPRQYCDQVRGALTLLLTEKQQSSRPISAPRGDDGSISTTKATSTTVSSSPLFIVCSVISVHGSARTAKIATVRMVRRIYRHKIKLAIQTEQQEASTVHSLNKDQKGTEVESTKLCHDLQERLGTILSID